MTSSPEQGVDIEVTINFTQDGTEGGKVSNKLLFRQHWSVVARTQSDHPTDHSI